MRKVETNFKQGTIKCVLNYLKSSGIQPKRVEYLEKINDVDKAYAIANRYIRNYISWKDENEKKDFDREVKRLSDIWKANGGMWLENDADMTNIVECNKEIIDGKPMLIGMCEESNEEFLSKILNADNMNDESINKPDIVNLQDEKGLQIDGVELMRKALEFGVDKFKANFLDTNHIDVIYVGYKEDMCVCYCNNINSFIIVER